MNQTVAILDFGGQYKELIARRVRECRVYSEILRGNTPAAELKKLDPAGIILTGGPDSVYAPGAPACDPEIFSLGIPVLGICYGMQLIAHTLGGTVSPAATSEYGRIMMQLDRKSILFNGLTPSQQVLMSHTDRVTALPEGFEALAHTVDCEIAAFGCDSRKIYGFQFHPEVENTKNGCAMLKNFLFGVCGAEPSYSMADYIEKQIAAVRAQVGGGKIILGLSGGVDSSVCAALLSRAVGENLTCIFVDHGFMRKNEGDEIEAAFSKREAKFVRVDAAERFIGSLRGVIEPEEKRKIIGREFALVFEEQAKKFGDAKFLAHGTIYPDVIESGGQGVGGSAKIKSHHNVGGLPKDLGFEGVVEPLRGLFKDEVRHVGRLLGLPPALTGRQPFPGPGLAIRIIGEVDERRLGLLREADAIMREEILASRYRPDQYFAVLTNVRSVDVMGDGRTYDYTLALRAVETNDFMTCEYSRLPHRLLARISSRITNEVRGINRVVYDITPKPPATIEWE